MINVKKMLADKGPSKTFDDARDAARGYIMDLKKKGKISYSEPAPGELPSIHIIRDNVPEAWEDTLMALMALGHGIHTHYDPVGPDGEYSSFPSLEATTLMHIRNPRAEPRFHKGFLGGWLGFGDYAAEIEGVKDIWMIQPADVIKAIKQGKFEEVKGDERWNYTYSQRFRAYPFVDFEGQLKTVNQIDSLVHTLKNRPTARTAQCITWDPRWDHNDGQIKDDKEKPCIWKDYHAPCLQGLWFRLFANPNGKGYVMNTNSRWRSRDHVKAVPSNIYGIVEGMIEEVRIKLEAAIGTSVTMGSYRDFNDSLHIYGHYFDQRKQGLEAERQLQTVFNIAEGQPKEERFVMPGTDMHEIMTEQIQQEYEFRKANPMFGSNM